MLLPASRGSNEYANVPYFFVIIHYLYCWRTIGGNADDQLFQNRLDVTKNTGSTCRRNYLRVINVDVDVKLFYGAREDLHLLW